MNLDLLRAPVLGVVSLLAVAAVAAGDTLVAASTLSVLGIVAVDLHGRTA